MPVEHRHLTKDDELLQTNEIHITALSTINDVLGDETLEYESRSFVVSDRPLKCHWDYKDHYELLNPDFSRIRKMARKRSVQAEHLTGKAQRRTDRKGKKRGSISRHC